MKRSGRIILACALAVSIAHGIAFGQSGGATLASTGEAAATLQQFNRLAWSEQGVVRVVATGPTENAVFKAGDTVTIAFKMWAEGTARRKGGTPKPMKVSWQAKYTDTADHVIDSGLDLILQEKNFSYKLKKLAAGSYTSRMDATPVKLNGTPMTDKAASDTRHWSVVELKTETVATVPATRARTKLGIGEPVKCTINPPLNAAWAVTGGGTLSGASGSEVTFTAKMSPSTSKVKATVSGVDLTVDFDVVAPSGMKSTAAVDTPPGKPGTNQIGFVSTFTCLVLPDDVSFWKAEFQENIPKDTWTWPDGTADSNPAHTVPWSVKQDNTTTDNVSSGLYPIGRLLGKDGKYKAFSFDIHVPEEYKDDSGNWVVWLPKEVHIKEFNKSQQGRGTLDATNKLSGGWQGPFE